MLLLFALYTPGCDVDVSLIALAVVVQHVCWIGFSVIDPSLNIPKHGGDPKTRAKIPYFLEKLTKAFGNPKSLDSVLEMQRFGFPYPEMSHSFEF